jgi:hypothetical protein
MKLPDLFWKIAPLVFSAGVAYGAIRTIPSLQERVQAHEVKLAEAGKDIEGVKEKLNSVERGVNRRFDRLEDILLNRRKP